MRYVSPLPGEERFAIAAQLLAESLNGVRDDAVTRTQQFPLSAEWTHAMELHPAWADAPDFALALRSCAARGFNLMITEPMLDPNVDQAGKIWPACFARRGCWWGSDR